MPAVMSVNKPNMRLWVQDLRITTAPQGQRYLRGVPVKGGPDEFCCLGRACEAAKAKGVNLVWDGSNYWDGDDYFSTTLPRVVSQWLGVPVGNPIAGRLPETGAVVQAGEANDEFRYTFREIADMIEDYYQLADD